MRQIQTIKCTHVVAQVSMGFYDAEGNLVGEELFPQSGGNLLAAKLFHPHPDQLGLLIEACVQQAWEKINAGTPASPLAEMLPLLQPAGADPDGGEEEDSQRGS